MPIERLKSDALLMTSLAVCAKKSRPTADHHALHLPANPVRARGAPDPLPPSTGVLWIYQLAFECAWQTPIQEARDLFRWQASKIQGEFIQQFLGFP
jgi:hypothetical protein